MILYHEWVLVHERSISPHFMKESQKEFEMFIGVVACRFLVYKYEYKYKYEYQYKYQYEYKYEYKFKNNYNRKYKKI